jgi:uncharacterized protein (DUF58 family)
LRRLGRARAATGGRFGEILARIHLTVAGLVMVAVAVVGWTAARWVGSRTMYMMVYGGLATMAAGAFLARRRLAIEVDRSELQTRIREGQTAEVTLRLVGQRRATTIVVEEALDPSLSRPVRVAVAALGRGEEMSHTYNVSPTRRGVYEIGPTLATWSDPFGLTVHRQRLADPTTLIVHPAVEGVHDRVLSRMWEDPPVRPPVSKPWPNGFEFYGMRDYVPGDDLRRVVWSAVARTGRMLVRESEQGITDRIFLVVDNDREWHSPGTPSETFEQAVRIAASLGVRHLADGMSVTLLANDERLGTSLRGAKARTELLDALARVELGTRPLRDLGTELLAAARLGSHVVLVTPFLDKAITSTLGLMLQRGASVVVVKVVWEESDPQSLARAVGVGCQVVQVPVHTSIEPAFAHQVGGGVRR